MNFAGNKDVTVQTFHVIKKHYCNDTHHLHSPAAACPGHKHHNRLRHYRRLYSFGTLWSITYYINMFLLSHMWTCSKCLRSPTPRVAEATRLFLVYGGSVKGNNNKAIAKMF